MRMKGSIARTRSLLDYLLDADGARPATAAEWTLLAGEAESQELDATLHAVVAARAGRPPTEVASRLQLAWALNGLRNARRRDELAAILDAFASAKVDAIVLKGMHVAHRVYPDPAMRIMSDLDILVHADALAAAGDSMRALGYTQEKEESLATTFATSHHLPAFHRRDASPVEIHWTISRPPTPFAVDLDGMWSRSRVTRLGEVEARVLGEDDLLVHLCLHLAYNHAWVLRGQREAPLRAVFDVALALDRLGPDIDWVGLAARANRDRTARHVYCALAVASRLTGRAAEGILERLEREPEDDAIVEMACELVSARQSGGVPEAVTHVAALRGTSRARAAWRALFPPRGQLRRRFALASDADVRPWHYLRRLGGFLVAGAWLGAFTARGRANADQRRRRAVIKGWKRRAAGQS